MKALVSNIMYNGNYCNGFDLGSSRRKNYLPDTDPIHVCANDVGHQVGVTDPAEIQIKI